MRDLISAFSGNIESGVKQDNEMATAHAAQCLGRL
jgi:hypothetical protein